VSATVTICIPTYRSEDFIARTVECARSQTYPDLRILISVDPAGDGTEQACHRVAREDARVEVVVQPERLGWSGNANAVLALVKSEYFFLYFHDDIIEPTYVETLLAALQQRPEAASVHCDLVEFGLVETTRPANAYEGTTLRRLVEFMMTQGGTTLRSLVRKSKVGETLRFPRLHGDSHWTAYVFHLTLLAAGPALAVHQPLYRRWQREGSLTRSEKWLADDLEEVVRILKDGADRCLALLDEHLFDPAELRTARYCLRLFLMTFLCRQQLRLGDLRPVDSGELSPLLEAGGVADLPEVLDAEAKAWVTDAERKLAGFQDTIDRERAKSGGVSA